MREGVKRAEAMIIFSALLLSAVVNHQIGRQYPSLEAMVGSSETVVVGRITSLDFEIPPGKKYRWVTMTVQVDELIKGEQTVTLRLTSQLIYGEEVFRQWQDFETRLLIFIPHQKHGVIRDLTFKRLDDTKDENEEKRHLIDWKAMYSMDFRLLDSRKKILVVARQFMTKYKGQVEVLRVTGYPLVRSPRFPGPADANRMLLPNVPEVKKMAQEMIEQPEIWLERLHGELDSMARLSPITLEKIQALGRRIQAAIDKSKNKGLTGGTVVRVRVLSNG